jgi:hypothetical protein
LALGEYLPTVDDADVVEGEVEIARLYLASGIGNTISIRAHREGAEIELRAVDEFGDRLSISPARAPEPLTNSELLAAVKSVEWHGPLAQGSSHRNALSSEIRSPVCRYKDTTSVRARTRGRRLVARPGAGAILVVL